jgi:sulfate transport system ATP-binding protein
MSIEVRNITKHFGKFAALKDVSLNVPTGELVALLGPSGSGKTTLLRIVAGLEVPDAGSGPIFFHDEDVAGKRVGERRVGFVFQHYALFRHMTVFSNIAFGLRVRSREQRPSREKIREKVHRLLELVQLNGMANRYPSQLSGGQRQRIALARALAVEPRVLLLDEPFGALDAKVRQDLRRWLRRLHDEIHLTSVFVTHDQDEAVEVADRLVVMNEGRIEQVGTPEEVFHHPASEFVMHFMGMVNIFHGEACEGKVTYGSLVFDYPRYSGSQPKPARIFIRPHDLDIEISNTYSQALEAMIVRINSAGPHVKMDLVAESGDPVQAVISHERYRALQVDKGHKIYVIPTEVRIFTE